MRPTKTISGLVLPESSDPQGYGRVLSCGDLVTEGTNIKEGDLLIFHPRAGMDIVMNKRILKVLKFEELYGILTDEDTIETLEVMKIGKVAETKTQIIQPATNIIQ